MSRMLKPAIVGLAISSLWLALSADLSAQSGGKKQSGKKSAVRPAQAEEAAPARPRTPSRPPVTDDANEGPDDSAGEPPRRLPRPQSEPLVRILTLDAETEQVLKDWEQHTSEFKKLVGEFYRHRYDDAFEVDKFAKGKFAFEAPDKGNYELAPGEVGKSPSRKKNKAGVPYTVQPDQAERWVCNGKEVIKIDEKEKTYEKVLIPPDRQGDRIIDGPLPFLFGMKADRAKQRYKAIELKPGPSDEVRLRVVPRLEADAMNWKEALVIIDARSFIPKAVKLTDPSGAETVHTFLNVKVNPFRNPFAQNEFKPNLKSYKPVLSSNFATGDAASQQKKAGPPSQKGATSLPDTFDRDGQPQPESVASDPPRKKRAVNRQ